MGGDRRLFLCANVSIQVQVYSTVTALTQTDLKSPNASADEITVYRYGFAYCFCFNSSESRLAYPLPHGETMRADGSHCLWFDQVVSLAVGLTTVLRRR